jgi:hypothetical protein
MKLCIEQTAEGFLVYIEGDEASYGEPVASVDEALEQARSMLGGGEMEEPLMEGEAEFTQMNAAPEEQEFVKGFKGPSGY